MEKQNIRKKTSKLLILLLVVLLFTLFACKNKKHEFDKIRDNIEIPETTITDIVLPTKTTLVENVDLSWSSDKSNVINNEGRLIRPDEDTDVTLTLTVTRVFETKTYDYIVKALGWEDQTLDINTLKDPQGFASLGVTSRANLKGEVLVANNELEFIRHLFETKDKSNVVIKITNDLNLGAKYVAELVKKNTDWDGKDHKRTPYLDGKVYRENTNKPTLHPTLLKNGVGQLIIDGRDGLMIYSETGITINHLTTHIKGNSNNIVFRNLKLQGIWEWDEVDRGDYKSLDWDHFTIEQAENIWLDHLTMKTSYDGLVDVKGGTKNITLSWLNLDFGVDEFIEAQFNVLEANKSSYPFYNELRKDVSKENISIIAAGQKKGFNFGNTEGGPGFESITITMHNIYARNLQDRFPRLRKGDVHAYNVVLDSSELQAIKDDRMKVISQGMIPTDQGALLMENSSFIGVDEPIKTHQASNLDEEYTGRFKVVNSTYQNRSQYYQGSSDDTDFDNPWVRSNNNVNYDLEFYFRNYQEIPYEYYSTDSNKLSKKFKDNQTGASTISGFNWLDIKKMENIDQIQRGKKIDKNKIGGLDEYITTIGSKIPLFDISLTNFYTGKQFAKEGEYTYSTNSHLIDTDVPGIYEITYEFYLYEFPDDVVTYKQKYIIYDEADTNEIYDDVIGRPFDNLLSGELKVYEKKGTIYYLLSNDANIDFGLVVENGVPIPITSNFVKFSNIDVSQHEYLHFVVVENEDYDELSVYTHKVLREIVVEITDIYGMNDMLARTNSMGYYYKLMNDLDFNTIDSKLLARLTSDNIFSGVFDGQGYAIKNLYRHAYGGGLFHTIANGKVKNITFDNVEIDIHETDIYDEDGVFVGVERTSARAGIVAGQIKGGLGILENITIVDSKVKSTNNYASILVGKVEGYSSAIIRNISVKNSEVIQNGEYAGGLIAGIENNTDTLIEDIYIDGLTVTERAGSEDGHKMIGILVGRVSTGTTINRVFITNVTAHTKAAIGGIFGKDDRKGQPVQTYFNDIYVDLAQKTHPNPEMQYFGNLIGNPAASDGTVPPIMNNVWGSEVQTASSGMSAESDFTIDLNQMDKAWYETNFSNLLETGLWEIVGNKIVLKR